jgi:cytochrome bd-type quinol oxidase subunit 1
MVEGLWQKTGDLLYQQIYRFWLNIFAMSSLTGTFCLAVVSRR